MNTTPASTIAPGMRSCAERLLRGRAELEPWAVWWLLGPIVLAGAIWLGLTAESFRYEEAHFWGAMLDTVKFLLCLFWLTLAWQSARNVRHQFWRAAARCAVAAGLLFVALTY